MEIQARKFNATKAASMAMRFQDTAVRKSQLQTREALLDQRIVEGYAVIWDVKNSHGEVFNRGAFAKSIEEKGPQSNSNFQIKFRHEHRETVAIFEELTEDDIGLYFRTKPLNQGALEDEILKKLRTEVYNNFSIGFRYVDGKYSWSENYDTIYLFEVTLLEISVVGIPSDEQTFAIRSGNQDQLKELLTETERLIMSLPRSQELNFRRIFSQYQSLISEPLHVEETTLETKKPIEERKGLDMDYILQNL